MPSNPVTEYEFAGPACTRCGCPVRFTGRQPGEKARLAKLSKTPEGYCASCAVSLWLQHDPMSDSLRHVIAAKGPVILLDRRSAEQMANVLAAGGADAKPQEIDWLSVVIHWDLPFADVARPKVKRKVGQLEFLITEPES